MVTHLVWLRNDLRLHDNTALHFACQDYHARVIAIFIATPQQWRNQNMSQRQAAFIWQNLCYLAQELANNGIELYYHQCADYAALIEWLVLFCQREKVDKLFYNYQYEFNEQKRDKLIEQRISYHNTLCYGFDDSVLLPPGSVHTKNQKMYKVYTHFRKAFLNKLKNKNITCFPRPSPRAVAPCANVCEITPFDYPMTFSGEEYPIGEVAALSRLNTFCYQKLHDYHILRDIPSLNATSKLSAWLAIGVLSSRQCYHQLRQVYPCCTILTPEKNGAFTWLNELIWRDFYRHLIFAWPMLCCYQPFIPWTRYIAWRKDDDIFNAWCAGNTGYPIVDAAMRQLANTGWINNRLRMITASFLVKDLLIDWRRGERYFMSQLIDGDLAANNGGWQWAASTGTDAVPYFRIFNPIFQGKRFDANGTFIRSWLPELNLVPDIYLHQPYFWSEAKNKIINYSIPIIDHNKARVRTIEAYFNAKVKYKILKKYI